MNISLILATQNTKNMNKENSKDTGTMTKLAGLHKPFGLL
jgi:hypothetical protein